MGHGATARCPHPGPALGAKRWPGTAYPAGLGAVTQVFLQVAPWLSPTWFWASAAQLCRAGAGPSCHTHPEEGSFSALRAQAGPPHRLPSGASIRPP